MPSPTQPAPDESVPIPPRRDRTWLYVGVVFVAFWAFYLAVLNPKIAPDEVGAPRLEGTGLTLPADYGWPLEGLDGKPVSLADFRGRPILLNLWATWCPPCRAEMPSLVRLAANPKLKGVAFVAVTTERMSPAIAQFAGSEMRGLTVLRADRVPEVFATDGIPATFVIAADGKVVASEVGSARWDDPTVVDLLAKLAGEAVPAVAGARP